MKKFWERKTSWAVAVLLLLVAIATLQSVSAPNHVPQQVSSTTPSTVIETTTETTTVTTMPNSSEIQPLNKYGVVRFQTTVVANGATLNIYLNSSVGPIYLEQLQIDLGSQQSHDILAAGITIGGLNGKIPCTGTIITAPYLYGDFLPTCPTSAGIPVDPAGNPAFAAAAGTSMAVSMQPIANEASPISGQVTIIATLCVPVTAKVTLTSTLQ